MFLVFKHCENSQKDYNLKVLFRFDMFIVVIWELIL